MNSKTILALLLCLSPLHAAETKLRIHDGSVWSDADLTKAPRTEITGKGRDGKDRIYSGIAMEVLLKLLRAPQGNALRGAEMNTAILVTAADGYRVVFSLAELDATFRKQGILLADLADGKPFDDHEGPLMLVCADDLRHSRWIRQVQSVALVKVTPPGS